MGVKTVKFGGTSLASASQIAKAVEIITADPERRYLVASAPGKRTSDDIKVTDLLYQLYDHRNGDYQPTLDAIRARFHEIASQLGVDEVALDLDTHLDIIEAHLKADAGVDYFASRGEYLNSMIIAHHLGWPFVDAAEVVVFSESGDFLAEETNAALAARLNLLDNAVVPGFYGATESGVIKTFSRGGSDVSGALVARAVQASVYENWTDVSGILMVDPRIVPDPRPIAQISYTSLRQLTYLGASVLHENAIFPVRRAGIPTNIRNTNCPEDSGTWIQPDSDSTVNLQSHNSPTIIGLAGRTRCVSITVGKSQWSGSLGIGAGLLRLFDESQIAVDLVLTSVDTWTIVVRGDLATLAPVIEKIQTLEPDSLDIRENLALIGVVTEGTLVQGTITAAIANSLVQASIDVQVDACVGSMQVVGVAEEDYENAVRAIYSALV